MNGGTSIRKFIKTSGVFFIGTVLSKAISILLLPLYTSRIPTSDMGYYDLSLTYITIVTSILFFDIWVAILRYMYDGEDVESKATYICSGTRIFYLSSALYLIVGVGISVFVDISGVGWIIAYGLTHNITNIFTFSARGYGRNVEFALSGIISTFVNVLSNIVFILCFSMGYQALYLSSILGCICQIAFLSWKTEIIHALFHGTVSREITRSMFKYSLPLCINSVSYWLLTSFNRIIINWVYGNSANGIYAVGNKFAFVISLATTCFTYAWQDLAFSSANKLKEPGRFYSDACNLYSKVLVMCMTIMLPCIKIFFPLLVNESYADAASTVPLFLINAIVAAISTFIGNVFYAIKDTKMIFYSMLASALLNLAIGYPLIKLLGLNGANIAVISSFVLNIFIRNLILKKRISFVLDKNLLWLVGLILLSYFVYDNYGIGINLIMLAVSVVMSLLLFRQYIPMIIGFLKRRKDRHTT